MGSASDVQDSWLGGIWSPMAQGRITDPEYKRSMNECLNTIPVEQGAAPRRSGTLHAGPTRGGAPGRQIKFGFEEDAPINMEFTDGHMRFRSGLRLLTTNDTANITSISSANPAVVTLAAAVTWSTADQTLFGNLKTLCPLLQVRLFKLTKLTTATFSLADAITGASIDGSTLGWVAPASPATLSRVLDIPTPFVNGLWGSLRSVQAQDIAVLLQGSVPSQILQLQTPPTANLDATFTLEPADFIDGPYLDPFPGSICTYGALSGNITLTFSFLAYSATTSYDIGDYVTSSGQGYESITQANEGNTPAGSPANWKTVNGGAPVGPSGFTAADIGRLIRLFSQPPAWVAGTSYVTGNGVSFAGGYWITPSGSTGVAPGTDVTNWVPVTGSIWAGWTWGRITGVSGTGLVSVGAEVGNMSSGGGLGAAFDGNFTKGGAASAELSVAQPAAQGWVSGTGYSAVASVYFSGNIYECNQTFSVYDPTHTYTGAGQFVDYNGAYYETTQPSTPAGSTPTVYTFYWKYAGPEQPDQNSAGGYGVWGSQGTAPSLSIDAYVGADLHTSSKQIASVTLYPTSDIGFLGATFSSPDISFTINLRGSLTAPSSPSGGTLLATTSVINVSGPIVLTSSDQATSYDYVWAEIVVALNGDQISNLIGANGTNFGFDFNVSVAICQMQILSPNVANGSVITVQIAGPVLNWPTTTPILTWQAGVYSGTTGYPTSGTYAGGRLWLSGVVANRVDSSVSNDIFTFSPTEPDGTVDDSNGISATFNADDVNPIFWMEPDLQGIICGTQGGEFLIFAPTTGPITPTNIDVRRATKVKCANILPQRCEHTLVFVQAYQRKLIEYFADVFSGKFSAPDLSKNAKHLTVNNIEEIAYQQELAPVVWARCGDGSLIGATYKRDTLMTSQGPTFCGWHRHALGSGRTVQSICVGPSHGGNLDALGLITLDPASGIYHAEVLGDIFDESGTLLTAAFLDDAIAPSSYVAAPTGLTLNGLWHLNGKTVSVWAGGLDCGDWLVTNGSITLTYGDGVNAGAGSGLLTQAFVTSFSAGAMPIMVGFTYTSQGQRLRPVTPADTGARNGPGFGKVRRNHQFAAQLFNTGCPGAISFGATFAKLRPFIAKQLNGVALPVTALYSGIVWNTVEDDYGYDGMLCWQVTRPYPATVCALGGMRETQDT